MTCTIKQGTLFFELLFPYSVKGVPNLAGSLFDNQLMMSGLEGSAAGGNNCNLGKDDAAAFCAGSLFSDGKVSHLDM